MRSVRGSIGLVVLLAVIQWAPVRTDTRRFELDDLTRLARVSDPQFTSDGKSIVAVISRANLDEDRWDGELAVVGVTGGEPRMLTSGRRGVSSPRLSPDGTRLAFLANE